MACPLCSAAFASSPLSIGSLSTSTKATRPFSIVSPDAVRVRQQQALLPFAHTISNRSNRSYKHIFLSIRNDNDDDGHKSGDIGESSDTELFAVGAATFGTLLLVGASIYSLATNPSFELDVDLYMSINRSLSTLGSPSDNIGATGINVGGGYPDREIVELPALSPAEQIVGAFFGPPGKH